MKIYNLQERASIVVSSIQNSQLTALGSVYLLTQGGYTSTIKAGRNIVNLKKRSFLKSGSYQVGCWLIVGQLGAPMSDTEVFVGQGGIMIREIKGTVIVNTGNDRRVFNSGQKNIFMKVNHKQKLESQIWPGWKEWVDYIVEPEIIEHWKQLHLVGAK